MYPASINKNVSTINPIQNYCKSLALIMAFTPSGFQFSSFYEWNIIFLLKLFFSKIRADFYYSLTLLYIDFIYFKTKKILTVLSNQTQERWEESMPCLSKLICTHQFSKIFQTI